LEKLLNTAPEETKASVYQVMPPVAGTKILVKPEPILKRFNISKITKTFRNLRKAHLTGVKTQGQETKRAR